MAKLFFVGLDGTEKSYHLQTHRPFTVGRDPGNDIILRDPKVSRHHAEIVFERGFFVLHDLASANGTFVNAKRVRVAPLTHGAQVRMGNTQGRFSEELPTEADASDLHAANDPYSSSPSSPPPPTDVMDVIIPTSAHQRFKPSAPPHDKILADSVKKKAE